jgi:hypothetical protein
MGPELIEVFQGQVGKLPVAEAADKFQVGYLCSPETLRKKGPKKSNKDRHDEQALHECDPGSKVVRNL